MKQISAEPRKHPAKYMKHTPKFACIVLTAGLLAATNITINAANFGDPIPGLTSGQLTDFNTGFNSFYERIEVTNGLGPVFNNRSCANCHFSPSTGGSGSALVTLFGRNANGVFDPLISQGGPVLQDNTVSTNFAAFNFTNAVDMAAELKSGFPSTNHLEIIPTNANVVANHLTPPLYGSGLIEAIPDSAIQANAALTNADGIVGTVAMVTDPVTGQQRVGRFGWKAQLPNLLSFAADASNKEIGRTSRISPIGQAPNGNTNLYNQLNTVSDPNDIIDGTGKADIDRIADYLRFLGAPPPVALTSNALAGQTFFSQIGCAICHTPSMTTDPNFIPVSDLPGVSNTVITALSGQTVNLYSDLLLHNMGSLNDNIALGAAQTNQMRTAPLWGLRVSAPYLHDGRATNSVDRAIRLHAGDAAVSASRYINLNATQQSQLREFLNSL